MQHFIVKVHFFVLLPNDKLKHRTLLSHSTKDCTIVILLQFGSGHRCASCWGVDTGNLYDLPYKWLWTVILCCLNLSAATEWSFVNAFVTSWRRVLYGVTTGTQRHHLCTVRTTGRESVLKRFAIHLKCTQHSCMNSEFHVFLMYAVYPQLHACDMSFIFGLIWCYCEIFKSRPMDFGTMACFGL